jgi:hypothetical protein
MAGRQTDYLDQITASSFAEAKLSMAPWCLAD